jgi:hypothetical protein
MGGKLMLIFFNRAGRKSCVGGYNVNVECKRMVLNHHIHIIRYLHRNTYTLVTIDRSAAQQ